LVLMVVKFMFSTLIGHAKTLIGHAKTLIGQVNSHGHLADGQATRFNLIQFVERCVLFIYYFYN